MTPEEIIKVTIAAYKIAGAITPTQVKHENTIELVDLTAKALFHKMSDTIWKANND